MRTFLVAIVASTEEDVREFLNSSTRGPDSEEAAIDTWWIAEDDRNDGSDTSYDSAIFVPRGSKVVFTSVRDDFIRDHAQLWDEEGYPFVDTSGHWYVRPSYNAMHAEVLRRCGRVKTQRRSIRRFEADYTKVDELVEKVRQLVELEKEIADLKAFLRGDEV